LRLVKAHAIPRSTMSRLIHASPAYTSPSALILDGSSNG
jgi:hypothetical protein